jgi:outer membrane protein assembly factor BamB
LRTRRLLLVLPTLALAVSITPVAAGAASTDAPWPQYQGSASRTGDATAAPAPPYRVAWSAATDIGDASHAAGIPAPIVADGDAIVVGRQSVDAVDIADGSVAWSAPRSLGPSSPAAVVGGHVLFVEGGGDESVSASNSPTSSPSATPSSSASPGKSASATPTAVASPSATTTTSTLVAIDAATQRRLWSVALSDVSHTGVLVAGGVAIVGADNGTVTAVDPATGKQAWTVDVGDHVLAPMAADTSQVYVCVRPETNGTAQLVALALGDGSEAWRYQPTGSVVDLGAPSVSTDDGTSAVYLVSSDGALRAIGGDGTQLWAEPLYTATSGSPPAVSADAVYVADQSGMVYAFDRSTGAERWRFATNHGAVGTPVVTTTAVLQPTSDGVVAAIAPDTGRQIWEGSVADSAIFGLAATPDLIVAAHTGSAPGITALQADPSGTLTDVASPTSADPAGLALGWLAAAVPLTAALVLLGRSWDQRRSEPLLAPTGEDDDMPVDPWEADLEDDT